MPHFECGAFNHSATSPGAKSAVTAGLRAEFYARIPVQTRRWARIYQDAFFSLAFFSLVSALPAFLRLVKRALPRPVPMVKTPQRT